MKKLINQIRLMGNLSAGAICLKTSGEKVLSGQERIPVQSGAEKIVPDWFWAARAVCAVFDTYAEAADALGQQRLRTVSAILIRSHQGEETLADKQRFSDIFSTSERFADSFLLTVDEETAEKVAGVRFYLESPQAEDLFFLVMDGDILDYQIPAGIFTLDLSEEGAAARKNGAGQDDYIMTDPFDGIRVVQDRYTRIYLIAGDKKNLMIDCGFGRGDLKRLQQSFQAGEWITALTHGHADHAKGCVQLDQIYGSRIDLELAEIRYPGKITELADGMQFDLEGRLVTVIELSGHSAEDYGFYVEPEQILICGDAIAEGPNYTMTAGGSVSRWKQSLQALSEKNLPIRKLFCSHRSGTLEPEAIKQMYHSLRCLLNGDLFPYGACVYGFGHVHWMTDGIFSFFTA